VDFMIVIPGFTAGSPCKFGLLLVVLCNNYGSQGGEP